MKQTLLESKSYAKLQEPVSVSLQTGGREIRWWKKKGKNQGCLVPVGTIRTLGVPGWCAAESQRRHSPQ